MLQIWASGLRMEEVGAGRVESGVYRGWAAGHMEELGLDVRVAGVGLTAARGRTEVP